MIPESVGATPFGIFLLADEFLEAARKTTPASRASTHGPTKLLAYHACELYLKTFLRSHGSAIDDLRRLQHDLAAMMEAAKVKGLQLPHQTLRTLSAAAADNEYVRVRYLVSRPPGTLKPETVLRLADGIREHVRVALNFDEFGNPKGALWAAGEPDDLLEARESWRKR